MNLAQFQCFLGYAKGRDSVNKAAADTTACHTYSRHDGQGLLSMKGLETLFCVYESQGKNCSGGKLVNIADPAEYTEYNKVLDAGIKRALESKPGITLNYRALSVPGTRFGNARARCLERS